MTTQVITAKLNEREKSFDSINKGRIKSSSKSSYLTSSLRNLNYPSTTTLTLESYNRRQIDYLSELKRNYYQIDSSRELEKPIYLSYESNANFQEKKFIIDLVRQLKENSYYEDIWFDKDEFKLDKPYWAMSRLEACEKSQAAIVIVTSNYYENQLSVYESKIIYDLKKDENKNYYLALILLHFKGYSSYHTSTVMSEAEEIKTKKLLQNFSLLKPMIEKADLFINFTDSNLAKLSLNEKVSFCVGCLTNNLDKYAKFKKHAPPQTPFYDNQTENIESISPTRLSYKSTIKSIDQNKPYKNKQLLLFKQFDVQQWLEEIGINEYHRTNFAEFQADGFLLCSCTDDDFVHIFDIDSKVTRKLLRNSIVNKLESDLQITENWHLKLKYIKPSKINSIYIIYDPLDSSLISPLLNELNENHADITYHQGFGTSKEEFLRKNAFSMANAKHILVYLTENSCQSQFVFFECIFCLLVLNRPKIVSILTDKGLWQKMKFGLKALLGEHFAIDFTSKRNIKPILQLIKPKLNSYESLVVLEKSVLDEQAFKPLHLLANTSIDSNKVTYDRIKVYISQIADHWETHKRLEKLLNALETFNIKCWFELFNVESKRVQQKTTTFGATRSMNFLEEYENVSGGMSSVQVLLCCITPKYLSSETCIKDIHLADSLKIPIIPIMLRSGVTWPPESVQYHIRKILSPLKCIDITSDIMLKRNIAQIISAIHTGISKTTSTALPVINKQNVNQTKFLKFSSKK